MQEKLVKRVISFKDTITFLKLICPKNFPLPRIFLEEKFHSPDTKASLSELVKLAEHTFFEVHKDRPGFSPQDLRINPKAFECTVLEAIEYIQVNANLLLMAHPGASGYMLWLDPDQIHVFWGPKECMEV